MVFSRAGVRGGKGTGHLQRLPGIRVGSKGTPGVLESFVVPDIIGIMDVIKSVLENSTKNFG